jgi:hypothetical protein
MVQDYEALYDRLCAPRSAIPVAATAPLNAHTR